MAINQRPKTASERSLWRLPHELLPMLALVLVFSAAFFSDGPSRWLGRLQEDFFAAMPNLGAIKASAAISHLYRLGQCIWLTLLFSVTGNAILKWMQPNLKGRAEHLAVGFCLGSGVWSYLFFALGLLGLLKRPVPILILSAATLLLLGTIKNQELTRPQGAALSDVSEKIFLPLLGVQLGLLLALALLPETFYDALEYHLGLPHLFLLKGAIRALPDNSFSGVPSVPSMLFGWALALDPQGIVAHLLNFSFLGWSLIALAGVAARLGMPGASAMAGIIFCGVPVVAAASYMTTVELPWAFYQMTCLLGLLAAVEEGDSAQRRRWFLIAGLSAGLAMSAKYIAWALPAAVLAFSWGALSNAPTGRPTKKELAFVGLIASALLLPWLAKNILFYRNPIFPFFHEFWNPSSAVMPGWRYLGAGATHSWKGLGIAGAVAQYLMAPFRMISFGGMTESAGIMLLPLVPLLAIYRLAPKERLVAWFTLGCWLPLSFAAQLPRYFIPSFLPLSLLVAIPLSRSIEPIWARLSLFAIIGAASLFSTATFVCFGAPRAAWKAFTGETTFEEYLSHGAHYYPAPLYPAARYLEDHAPKDARILLFGDSRGFQLPRDHVASTPGQVTVLERFANLSETGEDLKARLDAERISFIVVNHAEIVRQQLALRFSKAGKKSLDDFWKKYTLKVFSVGPEGRQESGRMVLDRWVVVYRVLSNDEASQDHPRDDLFGGYAHEGFRIVVKYFYGQGTNTPP